MILADTSVWIGHFRKPNARFAAALQSGQILVHPAVIGELACGNLKDRTRTLGLLQLLPTCVQATDAEAMGLLTRHRLWGRGIGWVDVHLIASVLLTNCVLWSLDARLTTAAQSAGVSVL